MNIAYMMGTSTSSALEALYGDPQKKKNEATEAAPLAAPVDRVSISAEALALAAARRGSGENAGSEESAGESSTEAKGAGTAGTGASGNSAASIEAKIKELQQKIMDVQNSNMPETSKQAMISSYETQLDALVQELNAIKSAKA